jgi:uncharacterized membrane protein
MNPARFFTVTSLAFGIALALLTPPFSSPDEPAHLYRAWSIASGRFMPHGGDAVPRSIVDSAGTMLRMTRGAETGRISLEKLRVQIRMPLRESDTVFVPIPADITRTPLGYSAPSYTPVGYAPSAAAVALGRLMHFSPVGLLYAARAANLLTATALLAWAIAIIPVGRWAMTLAALTPMAVFLRGSAGIDALLFASAFALVAAIIAARPGAAIVLTFIVCVVKPGYALIPLLAFAVPKLRRGAILLTILLALVAGSAMNVAFIRNANAAMAPRVGSRASVIVHQPATYVRNLGGELQHDAKLLTVETVAYFGWLDAPAPFAFALFWCVALAVIAAVDGGMPLTPSIRLLAFFLFVVQIVAIVTLLHIASEREFVHGLQGRYFLPLLPLALVGLASINVTDIVKIRIVQLGTAIGVIQSLWMLVLRYWL